MSERTRLTVIQGHRQDASGAVDGRRMGMFYRDDLFIHERELELHAAADAARTTDGTGRPGLIDRTRRSLGHGLIALGQAIGGVRAEAVSETAPKRADTGRGPRARMAA